LGSYYGASVCAVDLNADGLSDLLVGAPLFSTVREEGRVYVYINQGRVRTDAPLSTLNALLFVSGDILGVWIRFSSMFELRAQFELQTRLRLALISTLKAVLTEQTSRFSGSE
ncbi:integrin alpha-4, partial [Tachysurus ichikawai]